MEKDENLKNGKKLSIVVPNYNNEQYLDRSIQYLLKQSYKNVEIIVVNDGSPGNSDEIVEKYVSQDVRVKYVKHEINKGLFQARLTGSEVATGDYIAFLDADDYASIDFYRTLMENAMENNSDIVSGNTVMEYDSGKKLVYNLFSFNFKELNGENIINEYFRQEGLNFSWHTIWNKIYSMKIWNKAKQHYKKIKNRLLMTEDFAFSTVLFYYAKKMTRVHNDAIFYCQHEVTSTSVGDINFKKASNNINDLLTSFNFIEDFMKEVSIYDKYSKNFNNWKRLYSNMHRGYINNSKNITKLEKIEINKKMDEYCSDTMPVKNSDFFSSVQTDWDARLEKIKLAIMDEKIKYVSFDIFDTVVSRPLYTPTDLFVFLDKEYRKEIESGIDFSKIRIFAEKEVRKKQFAKDSTIEEITLDEIYDYIFDIYNIPKLLLNKLKEKEQELEIRFSNKRKTFFEVYSLALALNKKVIFTSDMYLPENTIRKILEKNDYFEYQKLYLSSTLKKMKATGSLYKYVLNDIKINPEEMIHIGDNYNSDYAIPQKMKINCFHVQKAIDVMVDRTITNELSQMLTNSLPFWYDTIQSTEFLGVRTMLAVVANEYFDNPFRPFNRESDFNGDPSLIGYYALGMYMFSVTNWLLKSTDGKFDKISFMARDGYLVMEVYKVLKKMFDSAPQEEYMYVSRKALIPVMISKKLDLYKLSDIFNLEKHSPQSVIKYLSIIMDIDEKKLKSECKNKKLSFESKFKTQENFNLFIKILSDNFFDNKKIDSIRNKLKKYFENIIGESPAVFDVGYSARPEYYLSNLCNKKISTYFLNINSDEALKYSHMGCFDLNIYFPAKPTLTGNAYELLLSKQAPSCIFYDCDGNNVKPVFEDYSSEYQVEYIVETMQQNAISFVRDLVNIFGADLDMLYYQDYYLTLPILSYFNSSKDIDKLPLSAVLFEDDIRVDGSFRMIDDMKKEINNKNQRTIDVLLNLHKDVKMGDLLYNPYVDLSKKNKLVRLMYYILFDRNTLNRRFKEIKCKFKSYKK